MGGSKNVEVPKSLDSLKPTKTYFIGGHYGFSQSIKIFDITDQITTQFGTDAFNQEALDVGKTQKENAWLEVSRNSWYWHNFTIESPEGGKIADWNGALTTANKNTINFSEGSSHSSHKVTMKVHSWWRFQDSFVLDSVLYLWKAENYFSIRAFTLEKVIAGKAILIGRFWNPLIQIKQGGILVLDTEEIDPMIGVLTCVVMLRKQRLAQYERHG